MAFELAPTQRVVEVSGAVFFIFNDSGEDMTTTDDAVVLFEDDKKSEADAISNNSISSFSFGL